MVGDTFESYNELKHCIKDFERTNYVQLVHRDSRTLKAAKKRAPKIVERAKPDLMYYTIHLTCSFGGKKYKQEGSSVRPRQSTFKCCCPAGVKLGLTDDCQKLTVTKLQMEHNHPISKEIYSHLPKQRKLAHEEKMEACALLQMKVNKKLLQQHLSSTTGKVVTLKDITNIQSEVNAGCDLDVLVTRLRESEGSTVDVFVNDDNVFTGLFYQDKLMKFNFHHYPEVLMVDSTYKLNDLRMPLYILLIVDGNGQSEVVALCLTSLETKEAITKMVQSFKDNNPCWSETSVVITDKDFVERSVFSEELPNAVMHICLFHALRSMRREVSCEKLGIRPGERDHALELLTSLAYATSVETYSENYKKLLETCPQSVITYYNSNWHGIRNEWVECFKAFSFTLGERTNNRLENINGKIKSVCSRHANLSKFFDYIFSVLSTLRNERDHNTIMALVKNPVTIHNDVEKSFSDLLTPYAFEYVRKQLSLRCKVVTEKETDTGFIVSSHEGTLDATCDTCPCKFATTMQLPCRHILAVREKKGVSLFSEVDVANRWKITYMQEVFNSKCDTTAIADESYQVTTVQSESTGRILDQHQKFRKAKYIMDQLPALVSEVGMEEFIKRMEVLEQLKDIWTRGGNAVVVEVFDSSEECAGISSGVQKMCDEQVSDSSEDLDESDVDGEMQEVECDGIVSIGNDSDSDVVLSSNGSSSSNGLDNVQLPPKMKKRGRPKGAEKTVIGLPRKKKKADKPIPFLKKQPVDKERVILLWFVSPVVAEAALSRKGLIDEDQVEIIPERVTASCLDENVCLSSCKKYFTGDGWLALEGVVAAIVNNPSYYCGRCTRPICDDTENSILCDSCLIWYHYRCVNIRKQPKSKHWFCRSCH